MSWIPLAVALALGAAVPAHAEGEAPDGAAIFAGCAVCHLPDGRGIEGSFPPIRGRLGPIASTPAGRDYLVLVLAKGLYGSIEVAGVPYFGAMPAQAFSNAEIAAVLNHVIQGLDADDVEADWSPFSAAEVGRIRTRNEAIQPQQTRALRAALEWGPS